MIRTGSIVAACVVVLSIALPAFGEYVYVEELPQAIHKESCPYPDQTKSLGISGTVMVQALVGKDGLVKKAVVVKSVPGLDQAAVACVRRWTFKPAMSKGVPVAVWLLVAVSYQLK